MPTWLLEILGPLITYLGIPLVQRHVIDYEGDGVSVADDPTKARTVVTIPGALASGVIGPVPSTLVERGADGSVQALGLTLGIASPTPYQLSAGQGGGAYATTVDATPTNLGTFTLANNANRVAVFVVFADIYGDGTNAGQLGFSVFSRVVLVRGNKTYVSGNAMPAQEDWTSMVIAPFVNALGNVAMSGLAGTVCLTPGVGVFEIAAIGFPASAITAWAPNTTYGDGVFVSNGGKVYVGGSGESDVSGGPTGTGTNIIDNGATWAYVQPLVGGQGVTVRWQVSKQEFLSALL